MRCTIEKLLNGEYRVVQWFRTANEKWDKVFAQINPTDPSAFAQAAEDLQIPFFEKNCGDSRDMAHEVMVVSAIARFRTHKGFQGNVRKVKVVLRGFKVSRCCIEVKSLAIETAASFGIEQCN